MLVPAVARSINSANPKVEVHVNLQEVPAAVHAKQ